ncbi:MAG TPA: nuclear transport factor 2 family protein [Solirubrobacterales bacterium]|jgi:ketosteroid isomerase-like protein
MPASLELVKIALQAYANGDCEIALALAGPHIRWDERASRPDGDLVWGRDKVGREMRRYLDSWEQYSFEIEDLAEVGPGKIVAICRERGRPKEGPPVDRRFGGLWVVEGGKIASWATYLTPREAVRAAREMVGGAVQQPQAQPAPAPEQSPAPEAEAEPQRDPVPEPEPEPSPEPMEPPEAKEPPAPPEPKTPAPFDFEAAEPADESEEAEPAEPAEAPVAERPRKRALTKSEEQKRAARARARLRKQSSRQSA